jgi:hypothetical protein
VHNVLEKDHNIIGNAVPHKIYNSGNSATVPAAVIAVNFLKLFIVTVQVFGTGRLSKGA